LNSIVTMNPELSSLYGPLASPTNAGIRTQGLALDVCRANLIGAAHAIVPVKPDGMIDTVALVESDRSHNLRVADLLRDTALRTIAVDVAASVDTAYSNAIQRILNGAQAGIWKWHCTNGLDHDYREIGSHAVCGLHSVVRFGPLIYKELYRLGGRVYGEKNCQKGIARLVKDDYLVQTRLGRKMLFGLHPRIAQLLPLAGTREHRDEVAFAAALESGRRIIVARHNKRRARV
jgi:hypothetical protein